MNRSSWRWTLWHTLPLTASMLALYYYWFAIADRYIVFLYEHDMGELVPDTSPFSAVTSSRYWMTGLVAGGLALTLYTAACWLGGRLARGYRPPEWRRAWAASSAPLLVAVPLITMTVNQPTLPLWNAAQTTLAAVLGLGLALMPGSMAAERPWDLFLLALDGWGMAIFLLCVAMLERVQSYLERGNVWPLLIVVVGLGCAITWLLLLTAVRAWRRWSVPRAGELFVAGLCVAYLLLVELHFVTNGYFYISDSDNFFSRAWALQALAWLAAGALALGLTRLRGALRRP